MNRIVYFKLLLLGLLMNNALYILYTQFLSEFILNLYYVSCAGIVGLSIVILINRSHIINKIKVRFESLIVLLIVTFLVWQLISCFINETMTVTIVARLLCWPSIFISVYSLNLSEKELGSVRKIINVSAVLLSLLCVPLIYTHLFVMQRAGAVIFPTYLVLSMTPLLLLVNEKKNAYNIIFLVILFISITTKRSGFFVAMISLIIYYAFNKGIDLKKIKNIKKILNIFIVAIFVTVFLVIVSRYIEIPIVNRILQMKNDGGSGRDGIWFMVFSYYSNLSRSSQIVGKGYEGVSIYVRPQGKSLSAHNDFLEILFDYGKIGLFIFILLWISLLVYAWILRKSKYICIYLIILISIFLLAMFSYLFIQSFIINYYIIALSIIMRLNLERRKKCL